MKKLSKRIATIAASLALVVVLGVALAACGGNNDIDKYVNRMEDAGYTVETMTEIPEGAGEEIGCKDSDIKWAIMAQKENNMVIIYKFSSEKVAKDAEALMNQAMNGGDEDDNDLDVANTDGLDDIVDNVDSMMSQMKFVRDGSVIFVGDQASIDIAQGK